MKRTSENKLDFFMRWPKEYRMLESTV